MAYPARLVQPAVDFDKFLRLAYFTNCRAAGQSLASTTILYVPGVIRDRLLRAFARAARY